MVKINGTEQKLDGVSLLEYLSSRNYDAGRVAVERNEEIVPKADYAKTVFADGDVVEIVSFVGGG